MPTISTSASRLKYRCDPKKLDPREKLEALINFLVEKYVGGEPFFDRLDATVRSPEFVDTLFKMVGNDDIVVSGKFGAFFRDNYRPAGLLLCVNGGLRIGAACDSLLPYEKALRGRTFSFVDDTYYSGSTRRAIEAALAEVGAKLDKCYIVYDGSKIPDPTVISLYRYWDHWDGKNRIK